MTNAIEAKIDQWIADFKAAITPAVTVVEADAETIGKASLSFIKTQGLQDLYKLALTLVGSAVAGAPWTATLAAITTAAVADGKEVAQGAVAVVAAQAQADLIAAGTLLPPATPSPTPSA